MLGIDRIFAPFLCRSLTAQVSCSVWAPGPETRGTRPEQTMAAFVSYICFSGAGPLIHIPSSYNHTLPFPGRPNAGVAFLFRISRTPTHQTQSDIYGRGPNPRPVCEEAKPR